MFLKLLYIVAKIVNGRGYKNFAVMKTKTFLHGNAYFPYLLNSTVSINFIRKNNIFVI